MVQGFRKNFVIPGATSRRPAAPKISKCLLLFPQTQTHTHSCPHKIRRGTRFLHKLVLWYRHHSDWNRDWTRPERADDWMESLEKCPVYLPTLRRKRARAHESETCTTTRHLWMACFRWAVWALSGWVVAVQVQYEKILVLFLWKIVIVVQVLFLTFSK